MQDTGGSSNGQGQRNAGSGAQQNSPILSNDLGQQNQGRNQLGNAPVNDAPTSFGTSVNPAQDMGTQDLGLRLNSQQQKVQIPAPEIDWSYAVIERLDPNTLKNSLLPFNLGRLVKDHDPTQNLELQPGGYRDDSVAGRYPGTAR